MGMRIGLAAVCLLTGGAIFPSKLPAAGQGLGEEELSLEESVQETGELLRRAWERRAQASFRQADRQAEVPPDQAGSDFPQARQRALLLAQRLKEVGAQADRRYLDGAGSAPSEGKLRRSINEELFGPRLDRRKVPGGIVHGDLFKSDEQMSQFSRLDGKQVMVLWSINALAFFYEPTVIDLADGRVFQGLLHADPEQDQGLFGPWDPGPEARMAGDFTQEQIRELEKIIYRELYPH